MSRSKSTTNAITWSNGVGISSKIRITHATQTGPPHGSSPAETRLFLSPEYPVHDRREALTCVDA